MTKQLVKVTLGYDDGSTQVVEDGSGHSIILSVTKSDFPVIEQLVAGKLSEIYTLIDCILERNPEILATIVAARIAILLKKQSDESGGAIDDTLKKIVEPKGGDKWN